MFRIEVANAYKTNGVPSCCAGLRYKKPDTIKGINGQYSKRVDYDAQGRIWRSNTDQIFVYDLAGRLTQKVSATNAYRPESQDQGIDLSDSIYEDFER